MDIILLENRNLICMELKVIYLFYLAEIVDIRITIENIKNQRHA